MPIFNKFGNTLKGVKKFTTQRIRPDNFSDLTDNIRNLDLGLDQSKITENLQRRNIPVINRDRTFLYKDVNDTKNMTRQKIKLISSLGKEPTSRRKDEFMPRALFNRHNLFGYTGLKQLGTIVDRFVGESNSENVSNGLIQPNSVNKRPKTLEEVNSPNDPRNNESGVFVLYSKEGDEGAKIEELRKNPTAENIVGYFGQDNEDGKFHAVEYDWTDFAMCKNYGMIPNNHMITLRRFPFPVQDNIYDPLMAKFPDIGRLVTWFGEGTNNSLQDLMKMEWGFVWKELQSEMQVIKSGPPSQSLTEKIFGSRVAKLARLTSTITPKANMFKNTVMQGADFYDFAQHNRMRIDGPVDSIDKIIVRDRGLTFEQKFTLTFEYEMQSIGGINPRLALLDALANVLFVTHNKGNFWGGGVRYQADLRQAREIAIGDTKALQEGRYFDYLKSVPKAFSERFKQLGAGSTQGNNQFSDSVAGALGPLLGSFAKPFANIASGLMGNMVDMFFGKQALASGAYSHMEIPNSLLTNQPVGVWHITVGNPFQPIAVFGNVILEKTSLELSPNLGWDDFPTGFKVTCELKHPIAKDRDDIQSVFNVGRGPLYHDAYIFNKKHIDRTIQQGGLTAYNPYENNYAITQRGGFDLLSELSRTKFGMNKILASANNYINSSGGQSGAQQVLQNQVFGWFLQGDN